MNFNFENKKVLVTGSSRGIGKAIADNFYELGAQVFYTSRSRPESITEELKKNHFICDFSNVNQIQKLKDDIQNQYGSLDVLVCNVGSGKSLPEPITSKEHFASVFNLNFTSAVDTTREFLPLVEKACGCILYVSSICGLECISGAPIDYSVAKASLQSFAKNLAKKIANNGVRVNCVAPGNILFPGGDWDKKVKENPEKVMSYIQSAVPMQKFGSVEDVVYATLFLCSTFASFITGSTLVVDGGQTSGF